MNSQLSRERNSNHLFIHHATILGSKAENDPFLSLCSNCPTKREETGLAGEEGRDSGEHTTLSRHSNHILSSNMPKRIGLVFKEPPNVSASTTVTSRTNTPLAPIPTSSQLNGNTVIPFSARKAQPPDLSTIERREQPNGLNRDASTENGDYVENEIIPTGIYDAINSIGIRHEGRKRGQPSFKEPTLAAFWKDLVKESDFLDELYGYEESEDEDKWEAALSCIERLQKTHGLKMWPKERGKFHLQVGETELYKRELHYPRDQKM